MRDLRLLKKAVATVCASGVVLAGTWLSALPAEAQTLAYDGKYWWETSCNDGNPVYTKTIPNTQSTARVMLFYSKKCRTVWALLDYRSPYPVDPNKLKVWVHRNKDGKEYTASSYWEEGGSGTGRWSRMLNDANLSSYAAGSYNGGTVVKTPSY